MKLTKIQQKRDKLKTLQAADKTAMLSMKSKKVNLSDVRSELREMKQSVSRLKSNPTRTKAQNEKMTLLESIIPRVEVKLRLDAVKLTSKVKAAFPTKKVQRAKLKEDMFGRMIEKTDSRGNTIYETVTKKLYAEPKLRIVDGQRIWSIPSDYSSRYAQAAKNRLIAKLEKEQSANLNSKLGRTEFTEFA